MSSASSKVPASAQQLPYVPTAVLFTTADEDVSATVKLDFDRLAASKSATTTPTAPVPSAQHVPQRQRDRVHLAKDEITDLLYLRNAITPEKCTRAFALMEKHISNVQLQIIACSFLDLCLFKAGDKNVTNMRTIITTGGVKHLCNVVTNYGVQNGISALKCLSHMIKDNTGRALIVQREELAFIKSMIRLTPEDNSFKNAIEETLSRWDL